MALLMPTFDVGGGSEFNNYVEVLQLKFLTQDISEEKKVPIFLTCIGLKTYSLLKTLIAPTNPADKKLPELIKVLSEHYKPKPVVIVERFKFNQCNQKPNESIPEYVAELKKLAITCDFHEYLNDALRNRFACGFKCVETQKVLLGKQGLTLTEAIETASSIETAKRGANLLSENKLQSDVPINKVVPHKKQGEVRNMQIV